MQFCMHRRYLVLMVQPSVFDLLRMVLITSMLNTEKQSMCAATQFCIYREILSADGVALCLRPTQDDPQQISFP